VTRIETYIDQRTTVCPDSREHETSLGFSVALAATRHDKSPEEMAASIPHAINWPLWVHLYNAGILRYFMVLWHNHQVLNHKF
jgi:hypothetical protein